MIGLELLSDAPLQKEKVGTQLRRIWQYQASIGLAQVIEDLLDEEPKKRMLVLNPPRKKVYKTIDRLVNDQISLHQQMAEIGSETKLTSHAWRGFSWDVLKSLEALRKVSRITNNPYIGDTRFLLYYSVINLACQSVIVSSFVLWTFVDLKVKYFKDYGFIFDAALIKIFSSYTHPFVIGDVFGNLPGRAVALTFGLIAAAYYANIFASLRVRDLNGWKQT